MVPAVGTGASVRAEPWVPGKGAEPRAPGEDTAPGEGAAPAYTAASAVTAAAAAKNPTHNATLMPPPRLLRW